MRDTRQTRRNRPEKRFTNNFHFHRELPGIGFLTPGRRSDSMPIEIGLDDEGDRWKWVCPNGHRSWEPTNRHFWCRQCAQQNWNDDVDPEFDQLRNAATGELVARDDVQLKTQVGYYDELEVSG